MNMLHKTRSARAAGHLGLNRGFTLIELMVSLLIGLVIVLGATQLFMVSRQSFRQVENLGLRQGAMNFTLDVLSRDIRRADPGSIVWDEMDRKLYLGFSGLTEPGFCGSQEIIRKTYFLKETEHSDDDAGWSLSLEVECEDGSDLEQPLVSGFLKNGLDISPISSSDGTDLPNGESSGLWRLTLNLTPVGEDHEPAKTIFQVMNRMSALSPEISGNLPADCYTPSGNIKGKCQ